MRELDGAPISFGRQAGSDAPYEPRIDLNRELVPNPVCSYFVRVQGEGMQAYGLWDGDVVIADRSRRARAGDLVVALGAGELSIRRVVRLGDGLALARGDGSVEGALRSAEAGGQIWGVITYSIHRHVAAGAAET